MKKIITIIAVVTILCTVALTTVFAHGHNGYGKGYYYNRCYVSGCNINTTHMHGNTYYSGHYTGGCYYR